MGTSAALMIKKKKDVKIIQYQSMDGGLTVTGKELFKNLKLANISTLILNLNKITYFSKEEEIKIKDQLEKNNLNDIPKILLLSIPDIIEYLSENNFENKHINVLHYDKEWIKYTEYIYLIDLDKKKFKIYTNKFSIENSNNNIEIFKFEKEKFPQITIKYKKKLSKMGTVKDFLTEIKKN